mgnify:CR=1 FL=1
MNTEDNNDFYDDELSRSLISNDFEDDTPHRKKKSKKPLVICLIILLIAAAAGGTAWYMMQRHKPVEATEEFLTGMQNMDFTTMENLLQSHDLSALDDADIRDSAYTDFFTTVNKKMTYKITKNKFDIQNGTARITVHMKYIDGTNIYAATIQEYTRKVAVAGYAGKEIFQDDIQEMLAALLAENASTADEKYSEIDITYPLIKIGSDWKIVSLDDTTVKVMCANFKSVKDEISSQLTDDSTADSPNSGCADEGPRSRDLHFRPPAGAAQLCGKSRGMRGDGHSLQGERRDLEGQPYLSGIGHSLVERWRKDHRRGQPADQSRREYYGVRRQHHNHATGCAVASPYRCRPDRCCHQHGLPSQGRHGGRPHS